MSAAGQANPVDRAGRVRSSAVDRWLVMLRTAISECGWKHEALAAAMAIDPAYLSRMLSGEKPWTVRHIVALPDDVEARFEAKRAESLGLIVVAPAQGEDAVRQFVSGLFGVLRSRLPLKADRMAKAEVA